MSEQDRVTLRLVRDSRLHPDVESIGETILRLYDQMIARTVIDRSNDDRHGQRLALAYYFGKIQRVTRLALTGMLTGQGLETMPMLRDQYDFMLRFDYYKYEAHEALLFALTSARLKLKFAEQIMEFDMGASQCPRLTRPVTRSYGMS